MNSSNRTGDSRSNQIPEITSSGPDGTVPLDKGLRARDWGGIVVTSIAAMIILFTGTPTFFGHDHDNPCDECCDDDTKPEEDEVCCEKPDGETTATHEDDCCGEKLPDVGEDCCNNAIIDTSLYGCCVNSEDESEKPWNLDHEQCCGDGTVIPKPNPEGCQPTNPPPPDIGFNQVMKAAGPLNQKLNGDHLIIGWYYEPLDDYIIVISEVEGTATDYMWLTNATLDDTTTSLCSQSISQEVRDEGTWEFNHSFSVTYMGLTYTLNPTYSTGAGPWILGAVSAQPNKQPTRWEYKLEAKPVSYRFTGTTKIWTLNKGSLLTTITHNDELNYADPANGWKIETYIDPVCYEPCCS